MSLVITNGTYFIRMTPTNGIEKTTNINEACNFKTKPKAIYIMNKAPNKTNNYFVFDTETQKVCWKRTKRKQYSPTVRKNIYNQADGYCQLCGERILFNQMTLDHIVPLSMGGVESVENLQCTCKACNRFKDNILPELFMDKIAKIFVYQMDKKYDCKVCWRFTKTMLLKLLKRLEVKTNV